MRDLKTKEAAIRDVATELRLTGTRYIQNIQAKHSKERDELLDLYRTDCQATMQLSKQARRELASVHKDLSALRIEVGSSASAVEKLRAVLANL
jgi:hypothetical protein